MLFYRLLSVPPCTEQYAGSLTLTRGAGAGALGVAGGMGVRGGRQPCGPWHKEGGSQGVG